MSVPQTVAEVLSKHVVLEVESIDRMYLHVYVPQLQAVQGTLKFIRIHRGHKVASTRGACCFTSRPCKSPRIWIESNHRDIRMKALEECSQRAGAAADFEHLLAWPKACLIKKRLSRCITADPAARLSSFPFGTTSATTPHSCAVRAVSGCGFSRNASALPAPAR